MIIEHLEAGSYETNCYILRSDETSSDCVLIDTGMEPEGVVDFLTERKYCCVLLVLTHGHADHIGAVGDLRKLYPDMQVLIHKNDGHMLTNPTSNLSALGGGWIKTDAADIEVEEPYDIETAGVKLKVLETPGHTPGGISLYEEKAGVVFTGDALFADSVGRTDFPKGDMGQLVAGIKAKLLTLADETVVYPGHGPATTIGQERKYNQYLQG